MNLPEGELVDGQFRIQQQIGQGGMGTVWAAEDLQLRRMVAAKFLRRELAADPRVRLRFQREARMTARVRSRHVVQVFAQGCTLDDTPYLIMELLEGEDLSSHLERRDRCGLRETANIVEQIARGLSCAHAEGLVHRDIKPQNIFMARADTGDAGPLIKLLDFGIAKDLASLRDSLTECGEVVGSALYSSPEQLRDPQSVERATDIWALGVVIFEMLTGRVPFPASSLAELIELHCFGRVPSVASLQPGLPSELDGFFERALHMDASERWASVEELAAEFTAIARSVSDLPASAPAVVFATAHTLRSSAATATVQRSANAVARYVGWALAALVLVLLGLVITQAWSVGSDAQLAIKPSRPAHVERLTLAPSAPPRASDAGSIMPAERMEDLPAPQPADLKPVAPLHKPAVSSNKSTQHNRLPSAQPDASAVTRTNSLPDVHQPPAELRERNHGF